MAIGVGAGALFPQLPKLLDTLSVGTISLPIAIGLLWMMYPPLARVKYEELSKVGKAWKMLAVSLIQNWFVGPVVMGWLTDRTGSFNAGLAVMAGSLFAAAAAAWSLTFFVQQD